MDTPLIAARWRRPAACAIALGALVFLALAVIVFHSKGTPFDTWVLEQETAHLSPPRATFVLGFTEPALSVVLLSFVVVLALSARRYDLATLAVAGPVLGTVLASWVLKPLVHRTLSGTVASYPSGHQTGVTCTAVVLLIAFGRLSLPRLARVALAVLLTAWVLLAAIGLVRFIYHYATDTIGAAGFSIALVLSLALAMDRWWPRRVATDEPGAAMARRRGRRPRPVPHRPRPPVDSV